MKEVLEATIKSSCRGPYLTLRFDKDFKVRDRVKVTVERIEKAKEPKLSHPIPRNQIQQATKRIQEMLLQPDFSTRNVQRLAEKIVRVCKKVRADEAMEPLNRLSFEEKKARFLVDSVTPAAGRTVGAS